MKFHQSQFINGGNNSAMIALTAIVPATSIGALMSTSIAPGIVGQSIAICCGIWMVIFPIYWQRSIDRQPMRFNLTTSKNGVWVGILLGLVMLGLILGSYYSIGQHWLNIAEIRARFDRLQMNAPLMVFGFGTFQTLVNSAIEEYVWRWFVYQKCELLVGKKIAVWLSAIFFTLHHIILMIAYGHDWKLVVIGTIAVFLAGVIWARCFAIYRSIIPSYISHLAADLALQIVSWQVLLG